MRSISSKVVATSAIVFALAAIVLVAVTASHELDRSWEEAQARQDSSLAVAAAIWAEAVDDFDVAFDADGAPTRIEWSEAPAIDDHRLVDLIGGLTGETTTLFVFNADDGEYTRRSTNILLPDGARAVGTVLGQDGAVHPIVARGEVFRGEATILGLEYATVYFPIHGPSGVEGVLYVGVETDHVTESAIIWTFEILVGQVVALVIGVVAIAWVVNRQLRGLGVVRDALAAAAEGHDGAPLVEAERSDEIGDLARAVDAYRATSKGAAASRAEAARRDAEMNARQAEMLERLRTQIGGVVAAATDGDFSARVTARFDEPTLDGLAEGINGLTASIEAGVRDIDRVVASMASGDFRERMTGDHRGAFNALQSALNGTLDALCEMLADVQYAVGDIGGSANQLSAGAEDLASRAELQASSLEETAATMEQLSATITTSAGNAERAGALADQATEKADSGGDVVQKTVEAMRALETSSAKITDIVAVIDGIAFQTNLLALNAAVEAARAGDSGKGFAVVASEVRALAQRSAEAATDIKSLIVNSTASVEQSVDLVNRTGGALGEIIEAVREVSGLVEQMTTAACEQSAGVGEITSAISDMDGITQQNSALAEQTASTSRLLTEHGDRLAEMVGRFQIAAPEGATRRAA